jgi:hypothetical protein
LQGSVAEGKAFTDAAAPLPYPLFPSMAPFVASATFDVGGGAHACGHRTTQQSDPGNASRGA